MSSPEIPQPCNPALLARIHQLAVDIAREAGEQMLAGLERPLDVEYKSEGRSGAAPTNPVTDVDRAVERFAHERVAAAFPDHGFLGEEGGEVGAEGRFLWAIDPVDGTTNYSNRFPLFAASVACLHDGVPIAGAIWCSTTPYLRPGVYHTAQGAPLLFEGEEAALPPTSVLRPLAAAPGGSPGRTKEWDNRVTGCAAIECAFVAAGVFRLARFNPLNVWDVAAGIALAWSAGKQVWVREDGRWRPFERFRPPAPKREAGLRAWRSALIIGEPEAVTAVVAPARPRWARLQLRLPWR